MSGYYFDTDGEGIATVTFDLPGKVNVMNGDFMAAMDEIVARLEGEPRLTGVILISAKQTFFAGGDLSLMGNVDPGDQAFLFSHFQRLKEYFRRLELLTQPVVAAINGSALGGGYELALACNHRIAMRRDNSRIGLPEIGFAILPGAGGVVRLTRLLGLERALDYLLTGRTVDPDTALHDGLLDEVVDGESALIASAKAWIRTNPAPVQPWDVRRVSGSHTLSPLDRAALAHSPTYLSRYSEPNNFAARRIVEVAAESTYLEMDAALRIETRALVQLMLRPEAAAAIGTFFEQRRANVAAV